MTISGFVEASLHQTPIPDRQVQQALRTVFQKFRELGSARQTAIWYSQEQIRLPEADPGTAGREITWRIPGRHRILQILKNPCYAGAFAWGRTATKTVIEQGRARQVGRHKKPIDQWKVLILDHHPGYISWEEYLRNQEMLEENISQRNGDSVGAAKAGSALLSGLLRCGHCGRKLFVRYSGVDGRVPRYLCNGGRSHRGSSPCITVGGLSIDHAVARAVLEAIQPVGIQAAMAAMDQTVAEDDQKRKSLELALEKARYEARRHQRQFDAVDPENRLVAGELESRWNEALAEVAELESRIAAIGHNDNCLKEDQRQLLLNLGVDLPSLWNHPQASVQIKKRILRTVLQEIVISGKGDAPEHLLMLHWKGGVHTKLRAKRNQRGKHSRATDRQCLELIEELSKVCDDRSIASILNRLGYRTGYGKSWLSSRIAEVRAYYRLPNYEKRKDWLTMQQVADELQVSCTVIRRLIKEGTLPARQIVAYAPWIIEQKDILKPNVQASIKAVHEGRRPPRIVPGQLELPLEIS